MNRQALVSFVAGGATAITASVVGLCLALVFGVVPRPSLLVPLGAVAAAAIGGWAAQRRLDTGPFRIGAAFVLVGAVGLLVTGGDGALRIALLAGGALATAGGAQILAPLGRPLPPWTPMAGLALVAVVLVRVVVGGGAFGHDESAYLVKAGSWVHDLPGTGWGLHRGIGQSVLAAVILPFTRAEEAYRLVAVVMGLGTVVAVGWLGRTVRSNRVGLVAAAVFAIAPTFLRRSAEFLTDIPSTGLLVVATILLWRWLTARDPRQSTLVWAAAVGAVAVYVRYQSVLSLGLLVVAAVIGYWDRVRSERRAVGVAAGVGLALLLPHFVFAISRTGSPMGIIFQTGEAGGREYLGEGLIDYLSEIHDLLAGPLGGVAIVVGIGWIGFRLARAAARRDFDEPARLAVFLGIPALGQILALGLISHGDPRFVFYPVALLITAAALAADDVRRRIPMSLYRAVVAGLVVASVASLGINGDRANRNADARGATFEVLVEAARTVRVGSVGEPCGALTGYLPQMTWYSGCPTARFEEQEPLLAPEVGPRPYLVFFEDGVRQPTGAVLDAYLALAAGEPILVESAGGSLGDARLYRVEGD